MTLRTKIAAAFVLCTLLAFTPLLVLMNTQIKRMDMAHSERQAVTLVESKAEEISSWLGQRVGEIRIIREHPAFHTMDMEALKPYITNLNQVLRDQYGNPAETFAVGGADGKGWVSGAITIDVSERDYFKEAMNTDAEFVISPPVISKSDRLPIFLICYPVREGGKSVGFINGSVNLEKAAGVIDSLDIYGGKSWMMDLDGNIYSQDPGGAIHTIVTPALRAEMTERLASGTGGKLDVEGARSLFYAPIPLAGDRVLCTLVDDAVIYAQTNLVIRVIVVLCAAMLLLTGALAVLISRTMTRPLEKLEQSMDAVALGNLDATFEGKGRDEVSTLGRHFNTMVDQIKELLGRVVHAEQQKRSAELKTLESQINPHFLYNTLDTLQWKALEKDNYDVADMVNALSRFFRISLSEGRELITLADEFKHVESYLEIQKVRYGEKISYELKLDAELEQHMVPKLLLQPLVENAIYHGLKNVERNGCIAVTAEVEGEYLLLTVADDGAGLRPERLEQLRADLAQGVQTDHYGLYNISERLSLRSGGQAKLTIDSTSGSGTSVSIYLPLTEEETTW